MQTLPLSTALFTNTQQKVLGLLFGKPDQSFFTNEIARWAQVGKGSLTRELERLQLAGILSMTRQGNQTHYQANRHCPIYSELLAIVRKTLSLDDHACSDSQGDLHFFRWDAPVTRRPCASQRKKCRSPCESEHAWSSGSTVARTSSGYTCVAIWWLRTGNTVCMSLGHSDPENVSP